MRSREQLERSPREYRDHQAAERQRIGRDLARDLARAREQRAPWYLWIAWRAAGEHRHDLRDEQGRAIACPVGGCDAVRGSATPHLPATQRGRRAS